MTDEKNNAEPSGASGGYCCLLVPSAVAAVIAAAVSFAMNAGGVSRMDIARIWLELGDHRAELQITNWCLDRIWLDGYEQPRPRTYGVGPPRHAPGFDSKGRIDDQGQ